jgi:hypothetical protein
MNGQRARDVFPDIPFSADEGAKQKRKKTLKNNRINHEDHETNNSNS